MFAIPNGPLPCPHEMGQDDCLSHWRQGVASTCRRPNGYFWALTITIGVLSDAYAVSFSIGDALAFDLWSITIKTSPEMRKTMILIQTWWGKDGKNWPTLNYELRKTFYMYTHSKLADLLTNSFFHAAMRPPANRTSFLRSTTVHESLGLLDCSSDEETCERLVSAIVVQWSGPARCPEPRAQFLRA